MRARVIGKQNGACNLVLKFDHAWDGDFFFFLEFSSIEEDKYFFSDIALW
jgi:hypothetical protein